MERHKHPVAYIQAPESLARSCRDIRPTPFGSWKVPALYTDDQASNPEALPVADLGAGPSLITSRLSAVRLTLAAAGPRSQIAAGSFCHQGCTRATVSPWTPPAFGGRSPSTGARASPARTGSFLGQASQAEGDRVMQMGTAVARRFVSS
nr:chemokine-like protein TAFA-5 isoform X1 [Marmota flaviventris]